MANLLSIDPVVCTRCGLCAASCPMGLLRIGSKSPRTIPGAEAACILCGHCVAACPKRALRHSALPEDARPELSSTWRSTPEAVEQLIKGRRSIRQYRPDPVDKATLLKVLDTARYAPTGMNMQPVSWRIVYEAADVKKLAAAVIDWMRELMQQNQTVGGRYNPAILVGAWESGYDPIMRGAPHLVFAHAAQSDAMGPSSCIITLTTAELAALPHGLGTCWAGFLHMAALNSPKVREALQLPDGHVMHGGLMIGYPAETYHSIPPRKPLDVTWG